MAIMRWEPTETVTVQEKYLLKRCEKKRKLFVFLRQHRREIFDDGLQQELEAMYRDTGAGKEPVCPALMAMALIIQGYLGLSDGDAVEATVVDLRWQMVLDRLGKAQPAFSQGALFDFRQRLIAHDMDRRLLERTAAVARSSKGFDAKKLPKTLRIAIDSSPLQGAGRVEDTINLIGHAARKVVRCVAQLLDWEFEAVCRKAGIPLLLEKSVKKALDRDWSDEVQKAEAVDVLARQVLSLERWINNRLADEAGRPPLQQLLAVLREIMDQDLEPDPDRGGKRIIEGVAKERQISVEDPEMRHGRKTKSQRIDGYKRHVATDLDSQAIVACAVTPANRPEHEALPELKADIDEQRIRFAEAHFDRAYMASTAVAEIIAQGAQVVCKPWKPNNGYRFSKDVFQLDLRAKTITCPGGHTESIQWGQTVEFDPAKCHVCLMRIQCTSASAGHGRTVTIAADEPLQKKLRQMQKTKSGRQRFRERVRVEHTLAHVAQRQGPRARYRGTRNNLFDLRRAGVIQNLEITQRKAA